jgi:hypothetical protein
MPDRCLPDLLWCRRLPIGNRLFNAFILIVCLSCQQVRWWPPTPAPMPRGLHISSQCSRVCQRMVGCHAAGRWLPSQVSSIFIH